MGEERASLGMNDALALASGALGREHHVGAIVGRSGLVAAWIFLGACSAYDTKLLGPRPQGDASFEAGLMDVNQPDVTLPDTSIPNDDAGDDDGGSVDPGPCIQGLDSDCPLICPEVCNGLDDNCDGEVDNGDSSTLCMLPNAEALCSSVGVCEIFACTGDFRDCNMSASDGCEALFNSAEHCRFCGNACTYPNATGQCVDQACAFDACLPGFGNCDSNDDNGCETSTNTVDNCGGCGVVCDPLANGSVGCVSGECGVTACDNGFDDCDGEASNGCETDLSSTVDSCGACGNVCEFETATASCSAGFCVPGSCTGGRADCDGMPDNACETDILTSETHCGACNGACTAGQLANTVSAECVGGMCSPTVCAPNFDDCDGNPQNGCETDLRTNTDCGACNTACAFTNGVASCSTGTCQLTGCQPLFGNCDSNASNGCERPTNTLTDCGGCGTPCNLTGGTPSCASGVCSNAGCTAPLADCNGQIGDGCEINTNSSMSHCGACNSPCNATASNGSRACVMGQCVLTCASGFGNCDGNASNGCETPLNSLSNCGMCGQSCSFPNAGASCATGTCQLGTCNPGFDNCTGAAGCETPLNTLTNCNGCGDTCALTNATEACVSGNCNITQCDSGFGSCDNNQANGCETPLNTLTNCNGCGMGCNLANASETCATQTCRINQCQGQFANCNNMDSDGCERATNTLTDCGGCGTACDFANASESCSTGSCQFGACNAGFGNCDNNQGNGCEQALNTITDCGGCDVPCARTNAATSCSTGSCALAQCDPGFGTCDGNDANGCETTLGTTSHCSACGDACGPEEMCVNFECRGSFPYTASNFDPDGIVHTAVTTINCNTTFNSATGMFTNWCSGQPMPSVTTRSQGMGNPDVVVLGFDALTINANNTLRLEGDKPIIIAVFGDATINGSINASANMEVSGPSGVVCSGTVGGNDQDAEDGASGGGGGGFGTSGGASGAGNGGAASVAGGGTAGTANLVPLRGGCSGGRGGRGHPTENSGREGGGAGGAMQLSVAGTLTIGGGAVIAAAGGGGRRGGSHEDGGGGGGSGGAILLEASNLNVIGGAWITANGGSGAGGNATNAANGTNGSNGTTNNANVVNGGNGGDGGNVSCAVIFSGSRSDGGRGGNGAAGATAAQAGANGTAPSGSCDPDPGGAGGGGGGGAGRIRIRARSTCTFSGNQSPNVTRGGTCSPPESNCVAGAHAGHGYWFCPNTVAWATASGLCQMSSMRLVRIDDGAENTFVDSNITAAEVAIGASDSAVESAWRWDSNNEQFWMGDSAGSAVGGRYSAWNMGEPNNVGGEHCAYMLSSNGLWNDNNCANATPYVCESQ